MKLSTGLLGSAIVLSTFAHAVATQPSALTLDPECERGGYISEITDFVQSIFNRQSLLSSMTVGGATVYSACRLVNRNAGTDLLCFDIAVLASTTIFWVHPPTKE
ncbi:hypothetical protein B0J18DRAFT_430837 [Chaetomium sp. MPI-SDFR-AT-0129]|nr:hypothetical protein B0J18DRAFT_430837 [Chaetomium sp. MPI-SDFR-AT-0129]